MKGTFEQLKQALRPLGELRSGGLQQLKIDCPNCIKQGAPKGKFNLEVSYSKAMYHCWACNIHGGLARLIKTYGQSEYISYFENIRLPQSDEEKNQVFELPPTVPVLMNEEATNYLINKRGLKKEKIREYNIKFCFSGPYKDCIIFPSYNQQGQLTYYCIHNYKTGKYRERKGKNHICFFESFLDKRAPIVITEGIYDALSVPNSLPLLGLKISSELLEYLTSTTVILALDSVVNSKTKTDIIKKFGSVCNRVLEYNVIGYKDLNEIHVADQERLISELMPFYLKQEFVVC